MSVRRVSITDIPSAQVEIDGEPDLDWRPVRHHLDVRAFGTNAYVGKDEGALVVEPHDEDEFDELYVVVSGSARFTVDGETFEAAQGELIYVTPPSKRAAYATAPDTVILAVGAVPGEAYTVSDWEKRWLAEAGRG